VILWVMLFGSVGLGYFIYGRRQQAAAPLVAGVALMVLPYLVSNVYLLIPLAVGLIALPYFFRA
jgi:hypothetical protein